MYPNTNQENRPNKIFGQRAVFIIGIALGVLAASFVANGLAALIANSWQLESAMNMNLWSQRDVVIMFYSLFLVEGLFYLTISGLLLGLLSKAIRACDYRQTPWARQSSVKAASSIAIGLIVLLSVVMALLIILLNFVFLLSSGIVGAGIHPLIFASFAVVVLTLGLAIAFKIKLRHYKIGLLETYPELSMQNHYTNAPPPHYPPYYPPQQTPPTPNP